MKREILKKRRAAKLNRTMESVALTKWSAKKQRGYNKRRLGKMGAASEVRHIDPATVANQPVKAQGDTPQGNANSPGERG